MASRTARAIQWFRSLVLEYGLKFGVVGLGGYAIDVGIFNILRLGLLGEDHAAASPLIAKVISVSIATLATWFGNRFWTFREHRRQNFLLELVEFAAIAVVGMGISLACLYVSHYVLGFTSLLADNISANVIGLTIATTFRFLLYRYWVYGHGRSDSLASRRASEPDTADAPAA